MPGATNRDQNVVRQWNEVATDAIVIAGANAPASSGVLMAIVQLGVYDAVMAIRRTHEPYATPITAPPDASITAAVAQSTHDVLINLLPAQADALNERLAQTLASVSDGPEKTAGIRVGQQAATGILTNRAGDGRLEDLSYQFAAADPGVYQPTPPAFSATPLVPWVARVRPFALKMAAQFRPGAPPSLDSDRWGKAYNETKRLGDSRSTVRQAKDSEIALFWTEHTARQWNRNILAHARRLSLDDGETARLLALANTAMADAWIACWDAKYHYSAWRPVTAIHRGHTDSRTDTEGDPGWTPFQVTPNHPEYPAAHACVSTAASGALEHFFGSDETTFTMDAIVGDAPLVHSFTRYSDIGREAAAARIYGGMHFEFSNEAGMRIGQDVVAWLVASGLFKPAHR